MKEESKKCCRCKYFDKYYTKEIKHFRPTKWGWCCQKRDNVNMHCGCENFLFKPLSKRSNRLLLYCLNSLLTELSEIRKVLETENDETNTDEKL